jgi:hypothetical protein
VSRIKKFKDFKIKEAISGTELVGPMGPGYGYTGLRNNTLSGNDTAVIYSHIDDKFYTIDDYNSLYNEYLKMGGDGIESGIDSGFSSSNIEKILIFLTEN